LPEGQKSLCFLLDRVRLNGRETPVDIYSVLGGLTGRQDAYAGALQAYLKGDFDSAASTFGSLGHPLGEYMKERCEGLASGGEDWMGYYSFSVK